MTRSVDITEIGRWIRCERWASTETWFPATTSARSAVEALVVETLIDGDLGAVPRVTYDQITPNWQDASLQASLMATAARRVLAEAGWRILDVAPTPPTLHAVAVMRDRERAVVMITAATGWSLDAGWLQVGAVLDYLNDHRIVWGGLLAMPRPPRYGYPDPTLETRTATALREDWGIWRGRIDAILEDGAAATPSPGAHCDRCGVWCSARKKGASNG